MIFHRKTVGLAFGSGGARGAAEVGAWARLLEENIRIDEVSGASVGAVVGALFCSNQFEKAQEIVKTYTQKKFLKVVDPGFLKGGVIKGNKLMKYLKDQIGDLSFSDLDIPLKIVATDLTTGDEVIFSRGSILDAIRASISVPLVFTPVKRNSRVLVDGGVLDPVPLSVLNTDVKIGIDLNKKAFKETKEIKNVMKRSIDVVEAELTKLRLNELRTKKDVVLVSPSLTRSAFDFSNLMKDYRKGYLEMDDKMDEIKAKIRRFL